MQVGCGGVAAAATRIGRYCSGLQRSRRRCYRGRMNPVLEDAIVAVATTLGAWLLAQQLSLLW